MFTDDTDLSKIPWQLLIRARTVDEMRVVLVRTVGSVVSTIGSERVREPIARAAAQTAARGMADRKGSVEVDAQTRIEMLGLAADIDDICPPWRRFPFPFPWPWPWPPIGPDGPWGPGGPGGPVEHGREVLAREVQLVAKVAALAKVAGLEHIAEAAQEVLGSLGG